MAGAPSFRYLKDPLFLVCLVAYVVNRWVVKPYAPNVVSRSYLNDAICIPFLVPVMLFGMRRAGLRGHDGPPTWYELVVLLVVWSVV